MGSPAVQQPRWRNSYSAGICEVKPRAKVAQKPAPRRAPKAEVARDAPNGTIRRPVPRRTSSPSTSDLKDPYESRRMARASRTLYAGTAASQASEAAQRQAQSTRQPSPRRSPSPSLESKARTPRPVARPRLSTPNQVQTMQGGKKLEAGLALRRLVDLKDVLCGTKEEKLMAPRPQKPRPAPLTAVNGSDSPRSLRGSSVLVHHMASEELFPSADDIVGQAEAASTACSPSLYSIGGGGAGSSTADERMRQLKLENQALREAFGDTQKRLMELEDERQSFLDEGVYDVVNSICGQTGLSPRDAKCLMGDVENKKTSGGGTVTYHIGRSAELSGENDKLRRELERTTKILEVLEQQKHQAEDKMMALEQEHTALLRRLAEVQGAGQISEGLERPERPQEIDPPRIADEVVEPVEQAAVPSGPSRQGDFSMPPDTGGLRNQLTPAPEETVGAAEPSGVPDGQGADQPIVEPWELEDAW